MHAAVCQLLVISTLSLWQVWQHQASLASLDVYSIGPATIFMFGSASDTFPEQQCSSIFLVQVLGSNTYKLL